jgi:hypothetical protein
VTEPKKPFPIQVRREENGIPEGTIIPEAMVGENSRGRLGYLVWLPVAAVKELDL